MAVDLSKLIGKILKGPTERDAVHIAILPCQCAEERLWASSEVGLVYGTTDQIVSKQRIYGHNSIGIVDPYIGLLDETTREIKRGDWVGVWLWPGSATGLRHHYYLPCVDKVKLPKNEHELWLRRFADKWTFNYDEMIKAATAIQNQDEYHYITAMGKDFHGPEELGEDYVLFWRHLEELTGKLFTQEHKANVWWSCSC